MPYIDTTLVKAVVKAKAKIQQNETRQKLTGALDVAFRDQNTILSASELNRIKKSKNQPTEIFVLGKNTNAVGTSRACSATGNGGSRKIAPVYDTISAGFQISHDEIAENEFAHQEILAHELAEAMRRIDEGLDAAAITALEARISNGTATVPYTAAAGVITVPNADHTVTGTNLIAPYMSKLKSQMAFDNYTGLQLISDPASMDLIDRIANQGNGNSLNNQFQIAGYGLSFSNSLIAAGEYSRAYVLPIGHFAITTWSKNFATGKSKDLGNDKWMTIPHPTRPGVMLDVKYQAACVDNSGTTPGAEDDLSESWVISVDYSFLGAGDGLTDTGIRRLSLAL